MGLDVEHIAAHARLKSGQWAAVAIVGFAANQQSGFLAIVADGTGELTALRLDTLRVVDPEVAKVIEAARSAPLAR